MTEALRQRDEHYFKGIKDVRMIRCMAHHKVPAFNSMEANGGECAVCVVDDIGKARDATIREVEQWKAKAIRVSGEADALERERDAALRETEKANTAVEGLRAALYEQRERADAAIRERDEALDAIAMLNVCVTGMAGRAERAEALLLAREKHNGQ